MQLWKLNKRHRMPPDYVTMWQSLRRLTQDCNFCNYLTVTLKNFSERHYGLAGCKRTFKRYLSNGVCE